ncbi:MAG: dihydrofolate reductase [Patescibacteria group bacterium]
MLSIIAAVADNNVIGIKNGLPWNLPEDLKRFKEITMGKPVLMGRNTFLSIMDILKKPFPGRLNVVISNNPEDKVPEGVLLYHDLEQALKDLADKDVYVVGGAMIYKQLINRVDKLYITHINKKYEGDVFFPEIDPKIWQKVKTESHEGFSFVNYERK